MRICTILYCITALIYFIAAINCFAANDNSTGTTWISTGTTMLCLGIMYLVLYLRKSKKDSNIDNQSNSKEEKYSDTDNERQLTQS